MHNIPPAQKGFTLLELLLALALTAMLLTMLSAGVYGVVRDWNDNHSGLETTLEETVAVLQIERALQGAFPHSFRDQRTLGRHIFFEGESQEVSWVSSVSPQRASGLTAWRLYSVPNEGVYLQLAPALSDYPGRRLDAAEPILLLENYTAEFSYLFEDLDENKRWRSNWDGEDALQLPLAVHVLLIPIDARTQRDDYVDILAAIPANLHRSIRPAEMLGGRGGLAR